jgi:heptosyltransferase-3
MEYLREGYTEVWAPGAVLPLIRFADRVRAIVPTGIDRYPPDVSAMRGFDSIVSWYGTKRPEFVEACAGLPVEFLEALPGGEQMHAVDFFAAQVGAPAGLSPRVKAPRGDGSFIAMHPFSGSARKNWPLENFRALAASAPLPVHFTAGPEGELGDAVRFEDLYELALWLASARAYVGNDSGISHLAAAVGTPVVALFGPTNPHVWAPRGPRVEIAPLSAPVAHVAGILASICAEQFLS